MQEHSLGDTVSADQLGKPGGKRKYMWIKCPMCHEQRWALKKNKAMPLSKLCRPCTILKSKLSFKLNPHKV